MNFTVFGSIPIVGNEDFINVIRSEITNESYRRTENFNTGANRIRSGKRGSAVLDGRIERTTANRSNDRLSVRQPESDTRGNSTESGRTEEESLNDVIRYSTSSDNDIPKVTNDTYFWEEWLNLAKEYGTIPKGENPARDVVVPNKTAKDKKVSETVRTILEAKATPDEALPTIEKMVVDGVFSYDVYTDKQAIKDAQDSLKGNGWIESYNSWMKDAVLLK